MQVTLQPFRRGQHPEQPLPFFVVDGGPGPVALDAPLQPAFLLRGRDVHVLEAGMGGIDLLHEVDNIAQFHLFRRIQGTRMKGLLHVGFGEVVEGGREFVEGFPGTQLQGVEVGVLVAAYPVCVDQAQNGGLFLGCRRVNAFPAKPG